MEIGKDFSEKEALRLMHERDQRDAAKLERLRNEVSIGIERLDLGEYSTKSVRQIFDEAIVRHKKKQ